MNDENQSPGISPPNPKPAPSDRGAPRWQATPIPSIDEVLRQLLQLNGAVVIGAISTKEAGLIQKTLKLVLDTQLKRGTREAVGPHQESLIELCRKDSSTLNALEPFLTDSQIQQVLSEISQNPDE